MISLIKLLTIIKFLLPSKYVLKMWVKKNELDWRSMLSANLGEIDLLKEKIEQEKI
jgi:hypothetical protein